MRFAILGSGSKGNAAVFCSGSTRVLVDCGFSRKQTDMRLAQHGLSGDDLDAILVTHEHADHVAGVARLSRAYSIPVYATYGTAKAAKLADLALWQVIHAEQKFRIGDIEIQAYPVPHDAREPVQFVLEYGGHRVGMLSDAGMVTPHICEILSGCDALLLECNHCPQMLQDGPYPPSLKNRVASRLGHLSNQQSAQLLDKLDRSRLRHLAITHVSEQNNCKDLASRMLADVLGEHPDWLVVADQETGLAWRQLDSQ